MVQWVVEAAKKANVGEVYVATPDDEILRACDSFGAAAIRTRLDHPSGTDRIAEVSEQIKADVYVNVQGDEPLVPPATIQALATGMIEGGHEVGSVYSVCPEEEFDSPAVVKVVLRKDGSAIYFSRYTIPFARNPRVAPVYKHIGLYAYREPALKAFVKEGPQSLEKAESLEQLRFLELGFGIQMFRGEGSAMAVDTKEQAEAVRQALQSGSASL